MPSAAILMASSVVMLKAHSYVATNYAMYQVNGRRHSPTPAPERRPAHILCRCFPPQEHVSRHGMRIVDEERDRAGHLPLLQRLLLPRHGKGGTAPAPAAAASTSAGTQGKQEGGGGSGASLTRQQSRSQLRRRARNAKAAARSGRLPGGASGSTEGEAAAGEDRPTDDDEDETGGEADLHIVASGGIESEDASFLAGPVPPLLQVSAQEPGAMDDDALRMHTLTRYAAPSAVSQSVG